MLKTRAWREPSPVSGSSERVRACKIAQRSQWGNWYSQIAKPVPAPHKSFGQVSSPCRLRQHYKRELEATTQLKCIRTPPAGHTDASVRCRVVALRLNLD